MNIMISLRAAGNVLRVLLLAGTCGLAACAKKQEAAAPVPVPVIAAPVIIRDQSVYMESMAQGLGSQDVEIRARVEGILESVHFNEGTFVKSGDLLYTIDPLTLEANLEQSRGNLAQAEAAMDKAKRDVARLKPLWEKNAISRQILDDAEALERTALAALTSAKAAVDSTRIQLGYTKIVAPIDGLIGKTEVKPGNLVGKGQSTLLTTISTVDPIHFRFSISEKEYLNWRRKYPDESSAQKATLDVFELILSDGTRHSSKGSVVFADRNVDPATGTLLLEVAFPNPGNIIRPGQFGRVRAPIKTIPNAVLVPQRAVQEMQATYSTFVVTPENRAEFRKVTPGARVDNLYIIESGLSAGENVVIEGSQKLQNNVPVTVTLQPAEPATSSTAVE
jgi:membrane fusion protein, multidrug efflux system